MNKLKLNFINWTAVFFFYIVFMAFVEGFRMPNLWSINYYIPSIFDGFFRRSFGGTLLWFFGDIRFNYYFVALFQFLILLLVLFFIYRAIRNNSVSIVLAALYFLSPLGGYLFHQVGYIDQLLYLLAFFSLFLLSKGKLYSSIFIIIVSMFFHEITLLTTLPILLFYILINDKDMKFASKFILLPLLSFLTIYLFFQTVPTDTVYALIDNIRLNSTYDIREGYFKVFTNEFLGIRMKLYYTFDNIFLILMIIVLSASVFILLNQINQNFLNKFFAVVTILSPLLLGFFGWDTDRWIFLSFSNFFIIAYLIYHRFPGSFIDTKLNTALVFIIFITFFSMPNLKYFDDYQPRNDFSKDSLHQIFQEIKKLPSR
jgi:hypothetical protein